MVRQDRVWARYSGDKVDIGEQLMRIIRRLHAALPLDRPLQALSVGCSNEPQFRILEAVFQGGLHLLDIEPQALEALTDRIERQGTFHVQPIRGDYAKLLASRPAAREFRQSLLNDRRMTLVTLHHSLYYAPRSAWMGIIESLVREILDGGRGRAAALHAVMMASRSEDIATTTWLYDHFAGRFFGAHNDQDLAAFARELRREPWMARAKMVCKARRVYFYVDDFEQFMGVVWMILLHPNVHRFSLAQQEEVTEFAYRRLWSPRVPLTQVQDHLAVFTGRAAGLA